MPTPPSGHPAAGPPHTHAHARRAAATAPHTAQPATSRLGVPILPKKRAASPAAPNHPHPHPPPNPPSYVGLATKFSKKPKVVHLPVPVSSKFPRGQPPPNRSSPPSPSLQQAPASVTLPSPSLHHTHPPASVTPPSPSLHHNHPPAPVTPPSPSLQHAPSGGPLHSLGGGQGGSIADAAPTTHQQARAEQPRSTEPQVSAHQRAGAEQHASASASVAPWSAPGAEPMSASPSHAGTPTPSHSEPAGAQGSAVESAEREQPQAPSTSAAVAAAGSPQCEAGSSILHQGACVGPGACVKGTCCQDVIIRSYQM